MNNLLLLSKHVIIYLSFDEKHDYVVLPTRSFVQLARSSLIPVDAKITNK